MEIDPIPARILQLLHPQALIYNQGFESVKLPDNSFDLILGNVPFGSIYLSEARYNSLKPLIHNHFLMKCADLLRPAGVMALITSTGTLDSPGNEAIRTYLAERLHLVAALRLPSCTFTEVANTEVTTDLIIAQKKLRPSLENEPWIQSVKSTMRDRNGDLLPINAYYRLNPEHLLGKLTIRTLYASEALALDGTGRNVVEDLEKLGLDLPSCYEPRDVDYPLLIPPELQASICPGAYCQWQGDLYQFTEHNTLEPYQSRHVQRILAMENLFQVLSDLLAAQIYGTSEQEVEALRHDLNQEYDSFVSQYGNLHSKQNEDVLGGDWRYDSLLALEEKKGYGYAKTAIFTQRTAQPYRIPEKFSTPQEGLIHCLNARGGLDLEWIAGRMQKEDLT